MVKFTVYGEPKAKGRPRVSVRKSADGEKTFARAYTPKQTVIYENLVKTTYQQIVGEVKLEEYRKYNGKRVVRINVDLGV